MASLPPIDLPEGVAGDGAFDPQGEIVDARISRLSAAARRRCAWCLDSGSANGAATRRCSRSISASPTSRSIWLDRRRICLVMPITAMATRSPFTATCSISATACWSSSPMAISRRSIARQLLFSTWQHMLYRDLTQSPDKFLSRVRGESRQGSRLSPRPRFGMGDPSRRRDRGKCTADGRRARLVLAFHSRTVRGR